MALALTNGWDQAIQRHTSYRSVEELEAAWLRYLQLTRRPAPRPVVQQPAWQYPAATTFPGLCPPSG